MNRDQRRAAKKNEAKNEAAMKKGGAAKGMQKVGEVLSSSLDGKDVAPGAPKKGMALENIKKESLRLREEAIKNAAKKKKEGGPKQIIGLPLEKEVGSVINIRPPRCPPNRPSPLPSSPPPSILSHPPALVFP